jgi:hypothetical protein
MFKKEYLAIIITLSFLLSGCKNNIQNADMENDIKFDSIKVKAEYHMLGDTGNPNCNLQSKFIYPVDYKDKKVLEKIKTLFVVDFFGENYRNLTPDSAVERYRNAYLTEYKSLEDDYKKDIAEDSTDGLWYNYYESKNNEITFNKTNIISYSVVMDCYTGGAHGSKGCANHVIDLKSGNRIKEEDIFADNFQNELSKIIIDALVQKFELESVAQLEEAKEIFNVNEILPNNNFLVDNSGITYTYNEYEIAPYAVGIIDVSLPFHKIKHLLKKNTPVYHLAK